MVAVLTQKLVGLIVAASVMLAACSVSIGQTQRTRLAFKPYEDAAKQAAASNMPLLVFGMTDT